jgi:hypothetical protein
MSKRTLTVIAATLICGLLVSGVALAMSSDNYRLDWFTPLTGGGGGTADSTNYVINLTVGQSGVGTTSSASYDACLGYWCGTGAEYSVYLPLVLRNY